MARGKRNTRPEYVDRTFRDAAPHRRATCPATAGPRPKEKPMSDPPRPPGAVPPVEPSPPEPAPGELDAEQPDGPPRSGSTDMERQPRPPDARGGAPG
jgi:hypothetical protein